MVGLLSLENCCFRPKMRKLTLIINKRQEVERNPVGYVSVRFFKASDAMREIQS